MTQHLVALGADFTLDSAPPELHRQLNNLAKRLAAAADDERRTGT
jgi:hypothetical protein